MRIVGMVVLGSVIGCTPEPAGPCTDFEQVYAWVDADGDGYGSEEPVGWVCTLEAGMIDNRADCDDASEAVHPSAEEACDALDNDCNGRVDEGNAFVPWYPDDDGDGYGVTLDAVLACVSPGDGYVRTGDDCDDAFDNVNPLAIEVCDAGLDNDCDGLADDDDPGVDPTTQVRWYFDGDGDLFGDDELFQDFCNPPTGVPAVDQGGDCDDARPSINPDRTEVCNERDDDCDGLEDDADPSIDPTTQNTYYADVDGDGFGNPLAAALACEPTPGIGVDNDNDCDDTNPAANVVQDWFVDTDGDGAGDGPSVTTSCLDPGGGLVPERNGVDCEPFDPQIYPDARDICGDGVDQNCSGSDLACATWMYTINEYSNTVERVDVDTLNFEVIGPLGVAFDFGDLAYDQDSGTLYMVDGRGAEGLYTVDLATGAATLVGIHGVTDLFGLTVDTSTGRLYGASFGGGGYGGAGAFFELDTNSGAATYIGNPGVGLDSLTYDADRDLIIGMEAGPGRFYSINPATGAGTLLGGSLFVNNGGMAWDPLDDDYWLIDWSGRLYRYEPTNVAVQNIVLSYLSSYAGLAYVEDPPF
jgi:hypothetical protein